jgi:O-antigen/teichoic acid export membrane protein
LRGFGASPRQRDTRLSWSAATLSISGTVARDTLWNLGGYGLPIAAAVFAIPWLVHGLGAERFGFISLAWVITGYFGLLDLGLGQSITRRIAGSSREDAAGIGQIVWNAALVEIVIGTAAAAALVMSTPWLISTVFTPTAMLDDEPALALALLALSVPFVLVSSLFRGVLEGSHRFASVNVVRVVTSTLNFAGPAAALVVTPHLAVLVSVIAVTRVLSCVAYMWLAVRATPALRTRWSVRLSSLRPIVAFSGWLSVSNALTALVVSVDRLIIGAVVSVAAVGFYVAPYEIVTKLWMFSASLLGALFPILSSRSLDAGTVSRLFRHAHVGLTIATLPAISVFVAYSSELLQLWLGADFAAASSAVVKWLAIGVFVNVLAQVPLTLLHGFGRSDITAKSLLLQTPLYVGAVSLAAAKFGVEGVAITWAGRAFVDAAILYTAVAYESHTRNSVALPALARALPAILVIVTTFVVLGTLSIPNVWLKLVLFSLCALLSAYGFWRAVLEESDRSMVRKWLRPQTR